MPSKRNSNCKISVPKRNSSSKISGVKKAQGQISIIRKGDSYEETLVNVLGPTRISCQCAGPEMSVSGSGPRNPKKTPLPSRLTPECADEIISTFKKTLTLGSLHPDGDESMSGSAAVAAHDDELVVLFRPMEDKRRDFAFRAIQEHVTIATGSNWYSLDTRIGARGVGERYHWPKCLCLNDQVRNDTLMDLLASQRGCFAIDAVKNILVANLIPVRHDGAHDAATKYEVNDALLAQDYMKGWGSVRLRGEIKIYFASIAESEKPKDSESYYHSDEYAACWAEQILVGVIVIELPETVAVSSSDEKSVTFPACDVRLGIVKPGFGPDSLLQMGPLLHSSIADFMLRERKVTRVCTLPLPHMKSTLTKMVEFNSTGRAAKDQVGLEISQEHPLLQPLFRHWSAQKQNSIYAGKYNVDDVHPEWQPGQPWSEVAGEMIACDTKDLGGILDVRTLMKYMG